MKHTLKYGLVTIALITMLQLQAQQHPYLFFTKEKVSLLQQRIKNDSFIATNWNSILSEANELLVKGDARAKIDYLSLAYLVTHETKYAAKVKEVLLRLCSMSTWSNEEMMRRQPAWNSDLKTAENCWTVAIGYDAIYDRLSADEKKKIVEGLTRMGIKPALGDWVWPDTRIHTLNSMGHNWWSACVGMAGIASLAIMTEEKQAAEWAATVARSMEEWYRFNGDELQFKPKTMDRDGGMYESFNYAQFGFSEFLFFKLAYTNALPGKPQPLIKELENYANWFMHASYPRNGEIWSLDFGDTHRTVSAERPVKLLYALGYRNPNMLWYISQVHNNQHREGLFPNMPLGLVYEPEMVNTPSLPSLPTSALYHDMDWAMMRNSWEKDATLLAVKSGYTWNHSHADANSYILYHKGEALIKDAGNSSYNTKEYPAYFFQSEAHNVVLANGKAQPKEQQYNGSPLRGELTELMDGGHIKYLMANATGPTAAYFTRNFRHFIWIGKVIVIIDDVKALQSSSFSWLLHPGGTSKKIAGDISIVQNNASILVRPLFPETLVQTGYDHDFPEKMKLKEITAPKARDPQNPTEIHYQVEYPEEVKQTKFITAIILKDSVNDNNLPQIERLHSETMNGLRITQNGMVTELYLNLLADGRIMHLNSINSFNNWETDAYLSAITYPEGIKQPTPGNITGYFVAYGSFLRNNGRTVFNTLSKLFMIASIKQNNLDLILQGQPLINASLYLGKKPVTFNLNHKKQEPVFSGNELNIRIAP
ncbi:heparinase II/III domain-containing protein [Filimonas effusa]|uniref:DUF4962 domain-containing protein n=1 Tax=Filimonas effusa TaxID=2508721 RepID=A0A4Q1DBL8_9BACT|nr:heparinase II/III family protein [Filimonas effusa]RXK86832.1 DUF4962 domain-containing protein [Filimonas effusa]